MQSQPDVQSLSGARQRVLYKALREPCQSSASSSVPDEQELSEKVPQGGETLCEMLSRSCVVAGSGQLCSSELVPDAGTLKLAMVHGKTA